MTVLKRMPGDAVKAAPESNGRIRVGGHTVRFTDEQRRDLHDQFFNGQTDYGIATGWSLIGKNILIEHGLDPAFKALSVGVFDLERVDDIGIYNEGWLRNKQDYLTMLNQLNTEKSLGWDAATIDRKADIAYAAVKTFCELKPQWSSGALPQGVEVDDETGHIKRWERIEASMTLTPAEPNGTEIAAMRSAFQELKSLLSIQTDTHEAHEDAAARKDATGSADVDAIQTINPAKERKAMTPEEIQAIVQGIIDGIKPLLTAAEQGEQMMPSPEQVMAAVSPTVDPNLKPEDQAKAYAAVQKAAYEFVIGHVEKKRAAVKAAADSTNAFLKRNLPAIDDLPAGGSSNGSNGHTPRITDMVNLKYAGLSAGEMALGLLMAMEPMQKMGMRGNPNMSEDYIRNMNGKAHDMAWRDNTGMTREQVNAFKSVVPYKANELDASNIVGQGYEWVSQFWATTIWETARFAPTLYDTMVKKGMMVKEVPQGADSVYFPTEGSDPVVYTAPQANSVDATGRPEVTANINAFGTGRVQLTPKELKVAVAVTYILEEDSIIDVVKQVNAQTGKKMLETRDQVIINGDTETAANTNINLIDGTPGVGLNTPYYINSNGLRKLALVTNTALKRDGGALSLSDYLATLGLLAAVLRTNKNESLFIIDPATELASLALPELATDDVRHTNATITSGEILNIYGRDVVVNGFLPLTNTAGKVSATAGNNLYGTIIAAFCPYFAFGWKRQITTESDRDILSGSTVFVTSMRMGITPRGTTGVGLSYDLAV